MSEFVTRALIARINGDVKARLHEAREACMSPGTQILAQYLLAIVEQMKEQLVEEQGTTRDEISGGIKAIRAALSAVYEPAPNDVAKKLRRDELDAGPGAVY